MRHVNVQIQKLAPKYFPTWLHQVLLPSEVMYSQDSISLLPVVIKHLHFYQSGEQKCYLTKDFNIISLIVKNFNHFIHNLVLFSVKCLFHAILHFSVALYLLKIYLQTFYVHFWYKIFVDYTCCKYILVAYILSFHLLLIDKSFKC